ncbi:MAG: trypsin-like peptidase domain-containing protein [Anaerolineae bacterium]
MSDTLVEFSDALAGLVERAAASLVRVEARRRLPASGIVWAEDGVIVTAHHVVARDEEIRVGLPGGEIVTAALVGRDPSTDIAVLRAETGGLTAPAWAEPESLRVGHLVLALGRPGRGPQATLGVISALGEGWQALPPMFGPSMPPGPPPGRGRGRGRHHHMHPPAPGMLEHTIQTDVVMYPGFSGGPLIDMAGQVIGLNTSALLRGISLTLAAPTLRRVVGDLLTHGRMRRGYLGVGAQPARLPEALATELGQETGLLVVSVEPGSPAERAGLLLGDTLLAVDGHPVRGLEELLGLLTGDRVGREVPIRILRGGELRELTVTIGERV